MAHYRKIDVSIWNSSKFQYIWLNKFDRKISVPSSLRNPHRIFSRDEVEARSKRCYFAKNKKSLFAQVSEVRKAACSSCGSVESLVLDHVVPLCWGGTNDIENLQILCSRCNSAKGGLLPEPPFMEGN